MESVWSVSKLSTDSVVSRRELVANSVHTANSTRQLSRVGASAVCIGHKSELLGFVGRTFGKPDAILVNLIYSFKALKN